MKRFKRITSLLLVLLIVCASLVSCNGSKDYVYKNNTKEYIFRYGDYTIADNFYSYWVAAYKAILMYQYYDIEDTDSYWDKDFGSGTANDVLTAYADENIKQYLISCYLFDKYKMVLSDEVGKTVDQQLSGILSDVYEGNVADLNKDASEYGINYKMLRAIYLIEAKAEIVYDYLSKNVFSAEISDEIRDEYLAANYAHTTHIFVATKYKYNFKLDENGNVIYDKNGDPVFDSESNATTDLTEDEIKEKEKIIAEIDALELNADNFDAYVKKYNEDVSADKYKNGYYFSSKNDYDAKYISAALSMKEGEVKKVEGTNGVYYIKKESMDQKPYSNKENADFFDDYDNNVIGYMYSKFMAEHFGDISVNDALKKTITIKTVAPCWYF